VKRDSLLVFHHPQTNTLRLVNKMLPGIAKVVNISLAEFDAVLFKFTPSNKTISRVFVQKLLLEGRIATVNLTVAIATTYPRRKFIKSRPAMAVGPVPRVVKPYWKKRSDYSRSKFSRFTQYSDVVGTYSDIRLKTSFMSKFAAIKFASWKLNVLRADLAKIADHNSLSTQFNNPLINWLVVAGFYSSFTAARHDMSKGYICVNYQAIGNPLYQVQVHDVITLSPKAWNNFDITETSFLADFAFVDASTYSLVILQQLNVNVTQSMLLHQNRVVKLADPLNSLLSRVNLLDRL
jgi:hypothetical protein